ncbi:MULTISPECIES: ArsR/SmtB family transcription factor [Bacillaceae]|uniref:ArsR/SmtB family transcription factor n=1 Tax=Bacillaceae TaxID=186817 RepID=UPI000C774C29|nr:MULTISPECIES: metalloregulator ArsR/SmtB family transcription factor [Bacillaceae]PLR66309.1 ArsR family transcriptional regulator [Bacillus sp. UMB0893]QNG61720.1 winged helix-turn-helix transcriptional regulator [Bacillus sp. PAMC26568]
MNILNTSFERKSFEVEVKHSILFECALGIAMITYPKLHDQLDKPKHYWDSVRSSFSEKLNADLQFCQEHNTWKMLLQLLHEQEFSTLSEFIDYIEELTDQELKYKIIPYLDHTQQENRWLASKGDADSENKMILACKEHAFFPQMIQFICNGDLSELRAHLKRVMESWFKEFLGKKETEIKAILFRDENEKAKWLRSLKPVEAVLRATGTEYKPEPNISKVLLIPQHVYRPWTIQANLEETRVFYYPVSDDSLAEASLTQPPARLVHLFKSLGDEKRLRIVKLLRGKERTLKELTDLLGLGKTTVHHHLALLRTAGIVKVNDAHYSLQETSFNQIEYQLEEYLERGE